LKFKVDENLPTEYAPILREAGFEADTVFDEKRFGALRALPRRRSCVDDAGPGLRECPSIPSKIPSGNRGLSSKSQDKPTLVALLKRLVPALLQFSPKHQLWIVEPARIRYREE
jgi:hypothetical protein